MATHLFRVCVFFSDIPLKCVCLRLVCPVILVIRHVFFFIASSSQPALIVGYPVFNVPNGTGSTSALNRF